MLKVSFSVLLTLLAIKTATATPLDVTKPTSTGPQLPGNKPCFMTGPFEIPKDVLVDRHVKCLDGKRPFKDVPDVFIGDKIYSAQDFQQSPELSPVAFALKHFTPPNRSPQATKDLQDLVSIYEATNAGLRTYGEKNRKEINRIKGPCFYLRLQLAISVKNLELAAHLLGKVLKNCVGCKNGEKEKVIHIALQHNVKVPEALLSPCNSH